MKDTPKCILCQTQIEASNFGIVILGRCICTNCEKEITNLSWDDPNYDAYKRGLKKIWCFKEA
ncbi:sigma factor G inhibitor Gin [Desulfotomaculum sp. 1211_IL3151]|uniref:sigma factor G inhibitor Gin n=1 Tax=Desulfotomaculum sp. 1211_IL3151 TaxID=3084055 RepID=UPI002FD98433